MADARAVVDRVRAHNDAGELLHQIVFFVRAARGADRGETARAVLVLDLAELGRDERERLVPRRAAEGAVGLAEEYPLKVPPSLMTARDRDETNASGSLDPKAPSPPPHRNARDAESAAEAPQWCWPHSPIAGFECPRKEYSWS